MSAWTPKFFKDIGKDVSDLFADKTYDLNKTVLVKTHKGDVNFESKTVVENGTATSGLKCKNALDNNYGAVEFAVNAGGEGSVTYTKNGITDGLDFTGEVGLKQKKGSPTDPSSFYSLGLKYKKSKFAATVDGDYDGTKGVVSATACTGYQGLTFALKGEVAQEPTKTNSFNYDARVQYESNNVTLALETSKCVEEASVYATQSISPSTSVAFGIKSKIASSPAPFVFVGGKTQLNSDAKVQGYIKSDGSFKGLYTYTLNPTTKFDLSASTDFATFFAGKPSTAVWGMKLTLGDL